MRTKLVTGLVATAATFCGALLGPGVADAKVAPAHPVFCDSADSYWYFVVTADWLKVHTSPGVNEPAVGQVPNGSVFCARAGSAYIKIVGGISWRYGYGHNGATKLTGWVDASYLAI